MIKHDLDLGQHFMVDETTLQQIVETANITKENVVLEIGSGEGSLSKLICTKGKKLICVETDVRLSSPCKHAEFHHANILDIIDTLQFDVVVANIPYHISEPLLIKLLTLQPKKITLVVGNVFAKKLLGESILGVVTNDIYDLKLVQEIHPISFNPQPKVLSALITLELKNEKGILLTYYQHQSSKVKNYLISILEGKLTKKEVKEQLALAKFPFENKKLYELSTEEFFKLHSFLETTALS